MKTIDFTQLNITDLNGEKECKDVSKELGNMIYKYTGDIAEMDLARAIYHNGHVELTPEQEAGLKTLIERLPIRVYLKLGILKMFENGTNE